MAKSARITVKLGSLTEPLRSYTVGAETTVGVFLATKELTYGSAVRVNGQTTTKGAFLKPNDVITVIEDVNGGR